MTSTNRTWAIVLAAGEATRLATLTRDLVYKSDGSLYFTDPPFGLPKFFDDSRKELGFSGVFRIADGKVSLVTDELDGPNDLYRIDVLVPGSLP